MNVLQALFIIEDLVSGKLGKLAKTLEVLHIVLSISLTIAMLVKYAEGMV